MTRVSAVIPAALRRTPTLAVITASDSRITAGSTRPAGRVSGAGSRRGGSPSRATAAAIRREKTRPSSRELEASRLAPCTPEQATSPVANRPGSDDCPSRSVATPPET